MKQKTIPLYDLSGDWLDMGRQLGGLVGDDIRSFNNRYFSDPCNPMRFGSPANLEKYVQRIGAELPDYSPPAHRFITGLADGAKLPVEQVLMQGILPELTHISSDRDWPGPAGGCTACCIDPAHSLTGRALIGQCWDFNLDIPNWFVAKLCPPAPCPQMLIVGIGAFFCCCGINKLGMGVTFTSSGHLPNIAPAVGIPLVALLTEALCCENYYEAMDTIFGPKKAGAFNILLADGYTKIALIEAAGNRVDMIEDEPILVCPNHYQHPGMVLSTNQDLNPADPPAREFARSSLARAERLRSLLKNKPAIGVDYLKQCLADHENLPLSICAHEQGTILHFRTQGAMILEPALKTIHFNPGPPCQGEFETFTL
ncbi:MAG: C45 family peptidase [Phycisphaerae bacterium]